MDKDIDLRVLYYGHDTVEISLLRGALESEGIPHVEKREVGMADMMPSVFFSPATEVRLYVARDDWDRAEPLARLVLGDGWLPPPDDDAQTP